MANPSNYTHGLYIGDRVRSCVSKRRATVIGLSARLVSVWWDDCCTPEWYAAGRFELLSNDCGDPPVGRRPVPRSTEHDTGCIGSSYVRDRAQEQQLAGSQEALELCQRSLTAERDRLDTSCARERGLRALVEDLEAKLTVALAKAAEGLCTWDEIPVGGYYVSPNDGKLRMKLRTESAMAGSARQFHGLHGADDSGLNTVWGAGVGCDPDARIWRRC